MLSGSIAARRAGSALVAAVITVFLLSLIAANTLTSISSRYNSAYRSASWNEALLTAESAIDVTLSQVFALIPNVTLSSADGLGLGYTQPSLNLLNSLQFSPTALLTNGTVLTVMPLPLSHGGEGGTIQQASVALDVVPLSQLLNGSGAGVLNTVTNLLQGNDTQLLRLRSTGTVYLTGGQRAGPSRLDNDLWQASLMTDRLTGAKLTQPTVSRQIEVILRPVYPFESAVVSAGGVQAPDAGTVFDSFNSTLPASSTNGQYDSLKRLAHGAVSANAASVTIGGTVYGNVGSNGGSVQQNGHVTGIVNNDAYVPLPLVNPPTWQGSPLAPGLVSGNTTLPAGPALLPSQYRFSGISGNLHITKGLAGLGTNVTIYVNGDVTGGIQVDPGITAQIYVSGSIATNASRLVNGSGLASNLQVYGVNDGSGSTPSIRINSDANLVAAIYAPGHSVALSGSNDVSGAIVAGSLQASGAIRVHFDESLAPQHRASPALPDRELERDHEPMSFPAGRADGPFSLVRAIGRWRVWREWLSRPLSMSVLGGLAAAVLIYLHDGTAGVGWRESTKRFPPGEPPAWQLLTAGEWFQRARERTQEGSFRMALGAVDHALILSPEDPDLLTFRGNMYESLFHFREAQRSYDRALGADPGNRQARENSEFCQRINRVRRDAAGRASTLYGLHRLMLDQGRVSEAMAVSERLAADHALRQATWQAELDRTGLRGKITATADGGLELDLAGTVLPDLALIKTFPVTSLNLADTRLEDIRALQGLALEKLDLSRTIVYDLSALRGMPLKVLRVAKTGVFDLTPLAGCPLQELDVSGTQVSNLDALAETSLKILRAADTPVANLAALTALPLTELDLSRSRVGDLQPLRSLGLRVLALDHTAVGDLSPLTATPLKELYLGSTNVSDLTPLAGMPLEVLNLSGCVHVIDLRPLKGCPQLEHLLVPQGARFVESLAGLPHLHFIEHDKADVSSTRQ